MQLVVIKVLPVRPMWFEKKIETRNDKKGKKRMSKYMLPFDGPKPSAIWVFPSPQQGPPNLPAVTSPYHKLKI